MPGILSGLHVCTYRHMLHTCARNTHTEIAGHSPGEMECVSMRLTDTRRKKLDSNLEAWKNQQNELKF